jgi:hypothetical protein
MRKHVVTLILPIIIFSSCEKLFIGSEPDNTAKNNFYILWKTYDENYAGFGVRNINWDSLYCEYDARITSMTTEKELWDISAELISKLDDGHVCLINKEWTKAAQSSNIIRNRKADDFSLSLVKSKYLENYQSIGAGNITYGLMKNSNIGYIHISTFQSSGNGNGIDWAYDIDKAISELANCETMVVDVRNNTGGLIITENIISSAFIDHKITFFNSRRKTGPKHDDFGELLPVSVNPRPEIVPFTKRIAFLTNRFTASGGEYMTQVFKNLSYSTQIGDTTMGAFGEITSMSELPNGWTFTYPCTLTTTPDGKCPEGIGIIPDILVENTKVSIDAGNDKMIEYAIGYLNR